MGGGSRRNATMKFKDDDYILGVWFGEKYNLFKVILIFKKDEDDKRWVGAVTYNYYGGGNRSFPLIMNDSTEEEAIETAHGILNNIYDLFFLDFKDYLLIKGNPEEFREKAPKKDWLHMKFEGINKTERG